MSRRNLSAYDNKLVASTLSHPSSATPGSATQGGDPATLNNTTTTTSPIAAVFPALHHVASSASFASAAHAASQATHNSGTGFGNSGAYAAAHHGLSIPVTRSLSSMTSSSAGGGGQTRPGIGAAIDANSHPSHPTSPWSVLTLQILPVFNGVPLGGSIEDLNVLAETHIKSCRTRSPRLYRRLVSSDLQELVSTGMLTVRAKLEETAVREDPQRLVVRIAEVWGFFWGLLPTLQGVFLPISLLAEDGQADGQDEADTESYAPNVRRLLLSGFLLHILLPILPTLVDALDPLQYTSSRPPTTPSEDGPHTSSSHGSESTPIPLPTADHLARIKHMSLILSTQAHGSDFFTLFEQGRVPGAHDGGGLDDSVDMDPSQRDLFNRYAVQNLLRAVAELKQQGHYPAGPSESPSVTDAGFSTNRQPPGKPAYPASVFRDRSDSGWASQRPAPPRTRLYSTGERSDDSRSYLGVKPAFDLRPSSVESEAGEGSGSDEFARSGTLTPGALEESITRRPSAVSQETMDAKRSGRV